MKKSSRPMLRKTEPITDSDTLLGFNNTPSIRSFLRGTMSFVLAGPEKPALARLCNTFWLTGSPYPIILDGQKDRKGHGRMHGGMKRVEREGRVMNDSGRGEGAKV